MRTVIDKASSIPLYVQTKEIIKSRIKHGTYLEGKRIPSEKALCDDLGISRSTIRQAVAELIAENVLMIQKGRGTFVIKQDGAIEINPFHAASFSFFRDPTLAHQTLLKVEPAKRLPAFLLKAYGIDVNDKKAQRVSAQFWHLIWIENDDNLPYAYCQSYVPMAMFPQLKQALNDKTSSLSRFDAFAPYRPVRGWAQLKIRQAGQENSMLLNCTSGASLLEQCAVLYTDNEDICEVNITVIRTDLVKLQTHVFLGERHDLPRS